MHSKEITFWQKNRSCCIFVEQNAIESGTIGRNHLAWEQMLWL